MKKSQRIYEIDILRAFAVIGMVIFHFFYILDYYEIIQYDLYHGLWLFLARSVQFTFLSLVGFSLALSWHNFKKKNLPTKTFYIKQSKRAVFILAMAGLVSLGTWSVVGEHFVRFGILHHIGTSILIFMFLARFSILNYTLAGIIFFIAPYIATTHTDINFLYIFGFNLGYIPTLDYFSLFPWSSLIALGIAIGNTIIPHLKTEDSEKELNFAKKLFVKIGQKALLIYMVHGPIIYLLLVLVASN